jgi:hypothetical protein
MTAQLRVMFGNPHHPRDRGVPAQGLFDHWSNEGAIGCQLLKELRTF